MSALAQLKEGIVEYLAAHPAFLGVKLCTEYPGGREAVAGPVLVVGIDQIESVREVLGGYYGTEKDGTVVQGAAASIRLRFDMYLPRGQNAGLLHGCYEALCERLMLSPGAPVPFYKMTCGKLEYDAGTAAMHLCAAAEMRVCIGAAGECLPVRSVSLKRRDTID